MTFYFDNYSLIWIGSLYKFKVCLLILNAASV